MAIARSRYERTAADGTCDADQVDKALTGLGEKLQMVGVVAKETVALIEPIKKIGSIIGMGLTLLL